MKAPFTEWAGSYIHRGFSPLPICLGFKHPSYDGRNMKDWSQYCTRPAEPWKVARWERANDLGICLAMGYGGLIGVDVDDPIAYGAVREVFGSLKAPAKIGQRGATAFFFDPTGEIKSKTIRAKGDGPGKIGGALVEFMGWGRQSVIPPTIHPKTNRPYKWHNGSLTGVRPFELPTITQGHISALVSLLEPHSYKPKPFEVSEDIKAKIEIEERERRRYEAYASASLRNTLSTLSTQGKGGRNQALFNAACALSWIMRAGIVSQQSLTDSLMEACTANGLRKENGDRDTLATIARAFDKTKGDGVPVLRDRERV